eukprot:TRINITY_DN14351_c0_g1_i1.p1 TRINITY_DN14351_c0_g1~~TRINITY_DN14351_c0_g1_i1.p1  ORF type:complete len:714 (+),score=78.66 TRINITY_DN14351_c0_g1_i1:319-2142(+)
MDLSKPWVRKFPRMPYHISAVTHCVKRMSQRFDHQVNALEASMKSCINVFDVHSSDGENVGCFEAFLHANTVNDTTRSGVVFIARIGWQVVRDSDSTNCIEPDFSKLVTSQDLSSYGPEISKPPAYGTAQLDLVNRSSEHGMDQEALGDMMRRRYKDQLPGAMSIDFSKLSDGALFKLTGLIRTNYKLGHYYSLRPEMLSCDIDKMLDSGLSHIDIIVLDSIHVPLSLFTCPEDYENYLTAAFKFLEECVENGKISYYGVDTHKCYGGSKTTHFVDLRIVQRAAFRAGGENNHLRLVTMPFNLTERGALLDPMADDYKESVFSFLRDNELGCLTYRPLSTYNTAGTEERYIDHQRTTDLQLFSKVFPKQLSDMLMLETRGDSLLANTVMRPAPELYQLGHAILHSQHYINNFYLFDTFVEQRFDHTFRQCMRQIKDTSDDLLTSWVTQYSTAYEHLKRTYRRYLQHLHAGRDEKIKNALTTSLGDASIGDTLSQQALNLVLATGVMQSVSVGLRLNYYHHDLISKNYHLASKIPMSVIGRVFTDPEVSFLERTPEKKYNVKREVIDSMDESKLEEIGRESVDKNGVFGSVYVQPEGSDTVPDWIEQE